MPLVCAQCGQENPDGFHFCGGCGAPLVDAPTPREVRKTVTVLFADVVGSTAQGEQRDPEAIRAQMSRWFDEARAILERHGGRVEKFVGDAVMAVFGIPQAHEDDALRAVRAAVELRSDMLRIGVNTGEVVAGEGETLVTGDAVNVAARLEQAAAPGEILIGAGTQRLVRDASDLEKLEPLALKGKAGGVPAFRLLAVAPDAPSFGRRLDAPLVGRERERARLRSDFEQAVSDRRCHLFTLLGTAGVGKSRLTADFLEHATGAARVLRGRCLHYGEGITYWPLVEILLQLGASPDDVIGSSPIDTQLTFRKLLERHAAEQPVVVVLDDLHWAEPVFLDLVDHIADWSHDAPIFLLCVARPELLELRPAWGGGKLNATTILLEPLSEQQTGELVDSLLDGLSLETETRARILSAAAGNPLFVEEMIAMVREDGADGELVVPPTIHALLQARLDRLGANERAVIERGAVEGQVFHRSAIEELGPELTEVATNLLTLVRKELIGPSEPTFPDEDAFRFRHLLIRDAAYESLPKDTRATLHERFADWLDGHAQLVEQDEIVGYHLEQAALYRQELGRGDDALAERGALRLSDAGRAALERGEVAAGSTLLGRALGLLPLRHPGRMSVLPDLVNAFIHGGRYDDARQGVEELRAMADSRASAYADVFEADLVILTGTDRDLDRTRALRTSAEAVFEELDDALGLALCAWVEGGENWMLCQAERAAAAYERGAAQAERLGAHRIMDTMLGMIGACLTHGPTAMAEAEVKRAALRRRIRSGALAEGSEKRARARSHALRGDVDVARELHSAGLALFREAGLRVNAASGRMGAALIEVHAGDFEAAEREYRDCLAELDELGDRAYSSTASMMLAFCLLEQGRYDEAREWGAVSRERTNSEDVVNIAGLDALDGALLAQGGETDEGVERARRGVARADETDFYEARAKTRELLAFALRARGDRDATRSVLEEVAEIYGTKGDVVLEDRTRALIAELVR